MEISVVGGYSLQDLLEEKRLRVKLYRRRPPQGQVFPPQELRFAGMWQIWQTKRKGNSETVWMAVKLGVFFWKLVCFFGKPETPPKVTPRPQSCWAVSCRLDALQVFGLFHSFLRLEGTWQPDPYLCELLLLLLILVGFLNEQLCAEEIYSMVSR